LPEFERRLDLAAEVLSRLDHVLAHNLVLKPDRAVAKLGLPYARKNASHRCRRSIGMIGGESAR
jgi:hypothetical protein